MAIQHSAKTQKDRGGILGTFKIREIDNTTGEVISEMEEKNVVTDLSIEQIVRSFSDQNFTQDLVETISLGDDVGTGTVLSPEAPSGSTTYADHEQVYLVPTSEFFQSYPDAVSVRYVCTVNGATVMQNYPSQPNVIYTSATLKTVGNDSFSYKRFPARTISPQISVELSWTIEFVSQ